jgi:hypothetical protein
MKTPKDTDLVRITGRKAHPIEARLYPLRVFVPLTLSEAKKFHRHLSKALAYLAPPKTWVVDECEGCKPSGRGVMSGFCGVGCGCRCHVKK